jgi:5-(carboxyamino)imidazole ribonucleotide synthase
MVHAAADAADWLARGPLLAEAKVEFTRELAVLLARSPHGQTAVYPVQQTVQRDGICREVIVPAPISEEHALDAMRIGLAVAGELDVVGLLAVELFDTPAGVLVNELAMRPHNSGHWSIDGAITSQFEQHLRAVLDWPLGDTSMRHPHAVMANVLGGSHADLHSGYLHCMAHDPGLRIHNYGKKVAPGRKVGHVTVTGHDPAELLARARHAAAFLSYGYEGLTGEDEGPDQSNGDGDG